MKNFVRAFLADRRFQIRSGRVNTQNFKNTCREPPGTIMSPIVFNIVMAKLVKGIAAVTGVHVTAYTDDVAIWTEADDHPTIDATVQRLQHALDTFMALLIPTGMEVSATKTTYLAVRGKATNRERIHLTTAGDPSSQLNMVGAAYWAFRFMKTGELKSG